MRTEFRRRSVCFRPLHFMLEKNARYLRRRISARSADSGGFENVPVCVYAGGHGYECNRDRVPDAWSFLRIFISKQKRGVFFPKKRRAFVLGLDWDCVLTDGCIVADCKPIRKLPRGMLFVRTSRVFISPHGVFRGKAHCFSKN